MNFLRLFFQSSYVHAAEDIGEQVFRAGHFYHVDSPLAERLVAEGVAVTEQHLEEAAKAEAEEAAKAAQPSAEDLDRVAAEAKAAEATHSE